MVISSEELIVGTWKHCKDDVFFRFFKDGGMYVKIPLGKYELTDGNLLKIELDQPYGTISGEPLFTNPQVLKVTIHEDRIIIHDLKINESDEQVFTRIR